MNAWFVAMTILFGQRTSALRGKAEVARKSSNRRRLTPKQTSAWPAGNLRLSPIRPFLKDGLAR